MSQRIHNVLGIDVGGTKIAAGIVQFPEGRVLLHRVIPTAAPRGSAVVLEDMIRLAEELCGEAERAGSKVQGVGIGLCELVSPDGAILSANSFDWRKEPVCQRLERLAPTVIDADVRAAARAEALFGAGRPFRIFVYVTVGTGISSCLMLDGKPFAGARGATGTMASSSLGVVCEKCEHQTLRTLEEFAAGPALANRFNTLRPGQASNGQDVLRAAKQGDEHALAVAKSAGAALGAAIAQLVNVLDPEAVVVGGGLGLSEGPYWDACTHAVRRHIWSEVNRDVPVLRAATGSMAGIVGAAAAAWAMEV